MAPEKIIPFSVASVLAEVLQQHGASLSDLNLASRKAEEAALRRYEAAGWLRKMVGVVGAKDFPAQPSEEEFRLGLRSGLILCNVLNKVQPGAVPKVVEAPCDQFHIPDGAPLSAYQYFENVRNFLVIVQEMGLPTFEASDLEQGGKTARIVNCVLALKSYNDWKQIGGSSPWKFGGIPKSNNSGRTLSRKNSEPFTNSLSRTTSLDEKSADAEQNKVGGFDFDPPELSTDSLNMLLRAILSDKKPEELPMLVESLLGKVVAEFESRLSSHPELMKADWKNPCVSDSNASLQKTTSGEMEMKIGDAKRTTEISCTHQNYVDEKESKGSLSKKELLFDRQQRHIQELRNTIHTTRIDMQLMQRKYCKELSSLEKHLQGLTHAACAYHKVLDENRRLYNQVQDLKGNIRVYCRVRPFLSKQQNLYSTVDDIEEGNIKIITPSKYGKEGHKSFNFNKVFGPSATQEEVFSDMQPLIRSVLDGYNVCIFAYGQTGSGKTYTMTGPNVITEQSQGVNYRALSDLFLLSEQRKDTFSYDISVQVLEIYNEQVRDLLSTDGLKRLEIRNSAQRGLNVPDANVVPVASTSDIIDLMNAGQRNRAVSATALNDRSSRSHSCLTVHVQGRDLTSGTTLHGSLHLVDLAGSERVDKSEVTGDRLKEAQHINKSLSALGDVISSLAQKNAHVPYRNSKLTQLLQDSLGGQAKTLMFVHISPELDAIGETISTLKFAERVASVELGAARLNKESGEVKELKEQIATLKAALAKKEAGQDDFPRSTFSSPERHRLSSGGSSPSHYYYRGAMSEGSRSRRMSMEGFVNVEVQHSNEVRSKRSSLDPEDVSTSLPPWPHVRNPRSRSYQTQLTSEYWDGEVTEVILKDDEDEMRLEQIKDNITSSLLFHQKPLPDISKVFPDQPFNKLRATQNESRVFEIPNRLRSASSDGSDEMDATTTSDSSELDAVWQLNLPKVNSMPNGFELRVPKPRPKPSKSQSFSGVPKSLIPSLIPPPSLKMSSMVGAPLHKNMRQPVSEDAKRKTNHRK